MALQGQIVVHNAQWAVTDATQPDGTLQRLLVIRDASSNGNQLDIFVPMGTDDAKKMAADLDGRQVLVATPADMPHFKV